ncbi:MAG: hypothetical protein KGS72_22190 [Cyanobacteria bacterium REEB67]|nr:hypothetical protein [Cyanobacteria bacterium REEB67]
MTGNIIKRGRSICFYLLSVSTFLGLTLAPTVPPAVASAQRPAVQIAPSPTSPALPSNPAVQNMQTTSSVPQPTAGQEHATVDLDSALHGLSVSSPSSLTSSSPSSSSSSSSSSAPETPSPVGLFFALPSPQINQTAADKKHGFLWHVLDNVGVPMFNNHDADLAPELRDRGAMNYGGLPALNKDQPAGLNASGGALFRQAVVEDQAPLIDK